MNIASAIIESKIIRVSMRKVPYIELSTSFDEELYNAIQILLPQVSRKKPLPSREDITTILTSNSTILLTARYPDEQGAIVGMLAFTYYMVPSGKFGHIDDVVVESVYRKKGIGLALIERTLIIARETEIDQVTLTSNPNRIAANQLYRKIGFKKLDTNVFSIDM